MLYKSIFSKNFLVVLLTTQLGFAVTNTFVELPRIPGIPTQGTLPGGMQGSVRKLSPQEVEAWVHKKARTPNEFENMETRQQINTLIYHNQHNLKMLSQVMQQQILVQPDIQKHLIELRASIYRELVKRDTNLANLYEQLLNVKMMQETNHMYGLPPVY